MQMIKPLNGAPSFTFQPIIKSIQDCDFILSPTRSDKILKLLEFELYLSAFTYRKEPEDSKKVKKETSREIVISKEKWNKSMIESSLKDSKQKCNGGVSFLSHMSVDNSLRIPRRPKSSQGAISKHDEAKKLLERFNRSFLKDKEKRGRGRGLRHPKSQPRSKSKENTRGAEGKRFSIANLKADPKATWNPHRSHCQQKEPHHIRKNGLREHARPFPCVPPGKAFPREMKAINKLITAEKQMAKMRKEELDRSEGKTFSQSVLVFVFVGDKSRMTTYHSPNNL